MPKPLTVWITTNCRKLFSSVHFSCSVASNSLRPRESQHSRTPCPTGSCPPPTPGVYPYSCPLSRWCHPTISSSHLLLLLPSILPNIRVFPNESALHIWWAKYWSFSFNISPSNNTQDSSPLVWTSWVFFQSKGFSRVFSNTTAQKHQFFGTQLSSQSNSHIHTWPLEETQPWLDRPLLTK